MKNTEKYVLLTDTDTELTLEEANKLGYKLIPMPYIVDNEVYRPTVKDIELMKYYQLLRDGKVSTTASLNPFEYVELFEPYLKDGKDIVYIHFAKAMSGTFNNMNIAIEELKETYPDRQIIAIDTKGITINCLPLVRKAAEMFYQNEDINKIKEWVENEAPHFGTYIFPENLDYFKRSGRVKGFAATIANIIGLKPIINFDDDGLMKPITKVRGTIGTINKIVDLIEEHGDNVKEYGFIVGHADNNKTVEMFTKALKERFGEDIKIESILLNPTITAHCGPGTAGVCFHCKNR